MSKDQWNTHSRADQPMTGENLRRALFKLSDDQREVILMRLIAGMPIGETAAAPSRSEDAVKGLQRRALTSLRKVLSEGGVSHANYERDGLGAD